MNRSIRCPSWIAFLAMACLLPFATSLHAQDPGGDLPFDGLFLEGLEGTDGPLIFPGNLPPLYGHAVAYDENSGQVILFGGYTTQTNSYTNETWAFDGFEWSQLSPATSPPIRGYHEMVWDPANNEIVMFGGYNNSSNELGDTWTWDGTDWTQLTPATSPDARYLFAMVSTYIDSVNPGPVLLFGGDTVTDNYEDQTWTWDGTDWTQVATISNPGGRRNHGMAFDPNTGETVLFGGLREGSWNNDTWTFNGTDWNQQSPTTVPTFRRYHAMEYNPLTGRVTKFGGDYSSPALRTTWEWDGTDWAEINTPFLPDERNYPEMVYCATTNLFLLINGSIITGNQRSDTLSFANGNWDILTGDIIYFDMSDRVNGIWHYTSINVPNWVEIRFLKNPANTPVFWLASEDVLIDGTLNLDGEDPDNNNEAGTEAQGGPGAFEGGLGGTRFDVSSTYAGAPGSGPGGGNPGVTNSEYGFDGEFVGTYGTASQIPLIGGSGGGGGASSATSNGGEGGGGGGAILVASKTDITVNGAIYARGGNRLWSGASYGGHGSGGAIRLVADRVKGTGKLDARGGSNASSGPSLGRVRVEAFYRTILDDNSGIFPTATAGAPTAEIGSVLVGDQPALMITSVAGDIVVQPPTGSSATPDVVFMESGSITVVVTGVNIPDGTPINLRITTSGQVINLPGPGNPQITLSGGTATFTVFVPAGLGNIQASAEFTP